MHVLFKIILSCIEFTQEKKSLLKDQTQTKPLFSESIHIFKLCDFNTKYVRTKHVSYIYAYLFLL